MYAQRLWYQLPLPFPVIALCVKSTKNAYFTDDIIHLAHPPEFVGPVFQYVLNGFGRSNYHNGNVPELDLENGSVFIAPVFNDAMQFFGFYLQEVSKQWHAGGPGS